MGIIHANDMLVGKTAYGESVLVSCLGHRQETIEV